MEALIAQIKGLPEGIKNLSLFHKKMLAGGLIIVVIGAVTVPYILHITKEPWAYVYSGLSESEGNESATVLRSAGIPVRVEGGGTAIAVEREKVYDARLILAAAGIPRDSNSGFELFDRSDIGVSTFTQNVNLRRAIEGELARTIRSLDTVRDARVHVSFANRGVFRDEDRAAQASVVLQLVEGLQPTSRQIAGIRHMVASATPDLETGNVTVLDGTGAVLASGTEGYDEDGSQIQRNMEAGLEHRIRTLMMPIVGEGGVIAKVTLDLDETVVTTSSTSYDPEQRVVRSERSLLTENTRDKRQTRIDGDEENNIFGEGTVSNVMDDTRSYEIGSVTTTKVARRPRISRMTVAVIVDTVEGNPRTAEELAFFKDLVKRAVGFNEERGDAVEVGSYSFKRPEMEIMDSVKHGDYKPLPGWWMIPVAVVSIAIILFLILRIFRADSAKGHENINFLKPGMSVSQIEEALRGIQTEKSLTGDSSVASLDNDSYSKLKERARKIVANDPDRAVRLLKSWVNEDAIVDEAEISNA